MANGPARKVIVNERAAKRLRDGHVWVYTSDVLNDAGAKPGALVHVIGPKDKILGSAIYSSSSQITLRLLGRDALRSEEELLQLIRQRLAEAVAYRSKVVQNSDACRLVFSEADRLPGLIVDRYNDVFTLQVLTQAWATPERKQAIIEGLKEFAGAQNIVERADARIRELEQLPEMESGLVEGHKSSTVLTMNGVKFGYDALGGQKTGAFLDQRENYAAAAQYAKGEALDVCTYQGGFALHLARVCDKVTAVDISREVLEVAEQNEKLNAAANKTEIEWIEGNAFDLMKDYSSAGKQYDTIVLDPPAFAKSKKHLESAIRGYKELNLRAMKMLRPGGVLITCSCSFAVSEEDFFGVLNEAAQDAHRSVRVLEKRTQAKD
ncbi:MAG TPA: class I SAM-dependent rRNA methyltransferase, partial [Candidatus Angelobacter sp.]|nr:class I SAM-dependent rRNA methyltransferase [Candidatus Angelobacter sp.]